MERLRSKTLSPNDKLNDKRISVDVMIKIEPIIDVASFEFSSRIMKNIFPSSLSCFTASSRLSNLLLFTIISHSSSCMGKSLAKHRKIMGIHADDLKRSYVRGNEFHSQQGASK